MDSTTCLLKNQRHDDDIVIMSVDFSGSLLSTFDLELEFPIEMDGSTIGGKNTEFHSFQTSN